MSTTPTQLWRRQPAVLDQIRANPDTPIGQWPCRTVDALERRGLVATWIDGRGVRVRAVAHSLSSPSETTHTDRAARDAVGGGESSRETR